MTRYTRRPSNLGSASGEDFIFSHDGIDVGRCYLRGLTGGERKWWWTIYIGGGGGRPSAPVDGVITSGPADTLEAAQAAFKDSFERMVAAGVVQP